MTSSTPEQPPSVFEAAANTFPTEPGSWVHDPDTGRWERYVTARIPVRFPLKYIQVHVGINDFEEDL